MKSTDGSDAHSVSFKFNPIKDQIQVSDGKLLMPSLIRDTHFIDVFIKDKTKEKTIPGFLLKEEGIQTLENIRQALFSKPVDLSIPLDSNFEIDTLVGKTLKVPAIHAVEEYLQRMKDAEHLEENEPIKPVDILLPGVVMQNKTAASEILFHSWDDVSPHLNIKRKIMEFYYPDMTPVQDQYGLPLIKLTYPQGDPLTIGPKIDISHKILKKS